MIKLKLCSAPPILRGLIFRPQKEKSEELLTKKQDLSSTFNTTSVLAKGFYHTAAHYPTVPCLRETIILWWHKHYPNSAWSLLLALTTPPTCKTSTFMLYKLLGKKLQLSLKHLSWLCLQVPKSHAERSLAKSLIHFKGKIHHGVMGFVISLLLEISFASLLLHYAVLIVCRCRFILL